MSDFTLSAVARADSGKGASRRLRRENGVPAIVYGGETAPVTITLKANELNKALESEAFYSSVINLSVDGKAETVILKDLQRHPAKAMIWHADFLRVNKDTVIKATVPLHFINEEKCKGVKLNGGIIVHQMTTLDIICDAAHLPEYIEVDVTDLDVGDSIHLTELKLPEGVEAQALTHGDEDHDTSIVSVAAPKGPAADAEGEEEAEGEE